jgi:Ca-activated chloride channel homolog
MSFQTPIVLLGLIAVPLVVAGYVAYERRRSSVIARFGNPALLPNFISRSPGLRRHAPFAVLVAALAALIFGVARPHAVVTVPREEATVMLAIDVSRSMAAKDVSPSRLDAARSAADAFLRKVPEKFRVGVVSFASTAQLALPPTEDRSLVQAALAALRPGEGTALGDAVLLAAQTGQRQRRSDGSVPPVAVLVISDGARDGGRTSPQVAAERARALHVPVYAIVLGTPNGTVERMLTGGFREIIRVPPRPDTLQLVARTTGGQFFTVTNDERLRNIYERLGSRLGHRRTSREITDVFAAGSAALLLAGGALSVLWFRRVP